VWGLLLNAKVAETFAEVDMAPYAQLSKITLKGNKKITLSLHTGPKTDPVRLADEHRRWRARHLALLPPLLAAGVLAA
jgi:hypothetical protein